MIKSSVETETSEIKFPIIARHKGEGIVVLFWSDKNGTVIGGENGMNKIGRFSNTWLSINSLNWEILPVGSKVILEVA